nr:MAG TPA: hypothetical protein [Caudoviricetes sp.]
MCYSLFINKSKRGDQQMDAIKDIAARIQQGLDTNADATKLVLLGIQTGYNLRAMEQPSAEKQDKQAS